MTTDTYGFRHGDDGYYVTCNGVDICRCDTILDAVIKIEEMLYGKNRNDCGGTEA